MSGPQGSDPNQPWAPPQQGEQQPGQGQDQPPAGSEESTPQSPTWQQPPAYTPPQQYPSYQPPYPQGTPPTTDFGAQSYPQTEQYGQPPQYGQPQYGQPGQYAQQPDYSAQGQPPQYGQPGQYGQFSPYGQPGAEQSSKRSLAVIGGVVGGLAAIIVAAVLVLGFWKPGFFVTTKLDVGRAQAGVQQVLTDETNGYGAKNVKDVKCNNGQSPKVKKGDTFNCEVSIDGTKRQVTVTFQDDNGTYEVGRPK
jgi:hypothetical protein